MSVVFDGLVFTSYSQLTVVTGIVDTVLPSDAFSGQVNGLCGAATRGALFLVTGTHTGWIPVRVTLHDAAPELGAWEDIVETSLHPAGRDAALMGWAGDPSARFTLDAPTYRVRWNARGMDVGTAQDTADATHPAADAYELMFWPAPISSDAILRSTSDQAAYWNTRGFRQS